MTPEERALKRKPCQGAQCVHLGQARPLKPVTKNNAPCSRDFLPLSTLRRGCLLQLRFGMLEGPSLGPSENCPYTRDHLSSCPLLSAPGFRHQDHQVWG